uniref:Uncharacterized protein n=1 Tax=viral metagenome TaxID=1070528 RepID=A0A6C0EVD8_9ZZZZ
MVKLNFAYINHNKLVIGKKYLYISQYYFFDKHIYCCRYYKNEYKCCTWFDLVSSKEKIQKAFERRTIIMLTKKHILNIKMLII